MNANEIKNNLNMEDIYNILELLNAEPKMCGNHIEAISVCHGDTKRKLWYYNDRKIFICYNNCGNMDIFGLLQHTLNITFSQAFQYVCKKFNIEGEYEYDNQRIDMSFIDKFNAKDEGIIEYNPLDKNILNSYYDIYYDQWIKEGISIEVMKRFNIKFSIDNKQIIIPHYDYKGSLIGIRCRNLDEELVDQGKKYMPVIFHNRLLNHSLGGNLYGLHQQLDLIKKYRTVVLVEAEKSVLQMQSFSKPYCGVALCGSTVHNAQIQLLLQYGVENVILALDKEYNNIEEEELYKRKINNLIVRKLLPYFNLSIVWDRECLLQKKDSPTDKGEKIFSGLLKTSIKL